MSNEERKAALTLWMEERHISIQALADAIGVSRAFVSVMLNRDTIPEKRHRQMLRLGFPLELLPPPYHKPSPFFPGLVFQADGTLGPLPAPSESQLNDSCQPQGTPR